MIRVLFVCLGNICRSPMAEAVFNHLVREAGLEEKIEADSAGTGDWHIGSPPHHGTRAILEQNCLAYDGTARIVCRDDLDNFDYIITMDDANLQNLRELGQGSGRMAPLLSYAPQTGVHEVPDPYFDGGFEAVYELIVQGCRGLLDEIRQECSL